MNPDSNHDSGEFTLGGRGSKLLVLFLFAWIFGFAGLAIFESLSPPIGAQSIESPFKKWDGVWEGELVTSKWSGEEVERLRVRVELKHGYEKEAFRQEGRFQIENVRTGEKRSESSVNTALIYKGELGRLKSQILRNEGREVADYAGRIEGKSLFWSRNTPGTMESIREWIEGGTYGIEGVRIQGDRATSEPLRFYARYQRVTPNPAPASPDPVKP